MYREIHAPFPGRPEAEAVPAATETAKTQQIGAPLRHGATPETAECGAVPDVRSGPHPPSSPLVRIVWTDAETEEDDHDQPIGWLDVC